MDGGSLASVHSEEEMALISKSISGASTTFWLGLIQQQNGKLLNQSI